MQEKEVRVVLRIEGGFADDGVLDIYDAANTINGLARSINIVAHSFANNDEVRTRANSAHGSQAFIHSSKKGCFEEQVDIRFNQKTIAKIGHSVLTNSFWDYLVCCWSASVGIQPAPTTPYVQKILARDEDFFHDIADALETPMQNLHESIRRESEIKIFLERPRVGDLMDARKQAQALLGFDSAIRYLIGKQAPDFQNLDFEIPVKVRKGCWEALIPETVAEWVQAGLGIVATAYFTKAAQQMAGKDFSDFGITDLFRKSIDAIKWFVKIGKHMGDLTIRSFENSKFSEDNNQVGIRNSNGDYLFVPRDTLTMRGFKFEVQRLT